MLPVRGECGYSLPNGNYKSKDYIWNLKIRVKMERETNEKKITQCAESPQREIELQSVPTNENEIEDRIISWQEKIFSVAEIKKYSELHHCKTSLELKYHQDVVTLTRCGMPQNRIYTYVDVDECPGVKDAKGSSNFLINRIENLRLRSIPKTEHIPKANIVDPFPTRHTCELRHVQQFPSHIMKIMANLNDLEILDCNSGEVTLCQINALSDGTLLISPDFTNLNSGNQPYRIEHKGKVFRCTLEHVSEEITQEELNKEKNQTLQNYYQHVELLRNAVGEDFEMLAPDILKIFLMGEIVSATNFGWSNLYINYVVELPSYWKVSNESQQLFGTTFTSSTTVENREDVAYFSYPFTIELILDINDIPEGEFIKFPQMLFEVWSQDFWNRYRVKGYGYIIFPPNPGVYKYEIQTWKPIYDDIGGQLREFFLGSSTELDDLSFPARAVSLEKEHPLSRLGLKTESAGSILVKMNIVHQSMNFLQSDKNAASLRALFSKFGSTSIQASVLSVLEAFQRARRRMLTAREKLENFSAKTASSELMPSTTTTGRTSTSIKSTSTSTSTKPTTELYSSSTSQLTTEYTSTSKSTSSKQVTSSKSVSDSSPSTSKLTSQFTSTSKTTSTERTTSSDSHSTSADYLPMSKLSREYPSTSKTTSSEHVTSSTPTSHLISSEATTSSFITSSTEFSSDTTSTFSSQGVISSRKTSKTKRIIPAIIHKTEETLSDVTEEDSTSQISKSKSIDDTCFSPSISEFDDTSRDTSHLTGSKTIDSSGILEKESLKVERGASKSEARLRRRQKKLTLPALSDVRTAAVPRLVDVKNITEPYSDSVLERKSAKQSYRQRTKIIEGAGSGDDESDVVK